MRFLIAAQLMLFVPESEAYSQIPCQYDVTVIRAPDCGKLGPSVTFATGINNLDPPTVVGSWRPCAFGDDQPYYWTEEEGFQAVQVPKGISGGRFTNVNDHNIAVGTYNRNGIGQRGFVYDINTGEWTELEPLPKGLWSGSSSINNKNKVCGFRSIGPGINPQNAFIWSTEDGFIDLGIINGPHSSAGSISDNGVIVGWTGILAHPSMRGFIYENGVTTILEPLLGGSNTAATDINNNGLVLVGELIQESPAITQAYVLTGSSHYTLAALKGDLSSRGFAINDSGIAVGDSRVSLNDRRATAWFGGQALDLNASIDEAVGLYLTAAQDINSNNEIVSQGNNTNGVIVGVLLTAADRTAGDTNCDGIVNVDDLGDVFVNWGSCDGCPSDFDSNGIVDVNDLRLVIMNWGSN